MVERCGLVASDTGQGPVMGFCEHGSESSGSLTGGEFLNYLSCY